MPFVDSHCHVALGWYEPVDLLLYQMDHNDVEHGILIQIMGQANNDYQAECVARYPDRLTSVIIVDAEQPAAVARLEELAATGIGGLRLRATTRSPGADPLAIWRAADRLGLAISCGGAAQDFASAEFAAILEALPGLSVVIEHLGSINQPTGDVEQEALRRRVFGLSRYPNAYMKIHGLGEFCRRAMPVREPFPFEEPIPPLLELAYRAFGAERLMWGSDYPPVSTREGYHNALRLPLAQLAHLGQHECDLIFGTVARRVFRPGR
jgi:L-fuconolactonase